MSLKDVGYNTYCQLYDSLVEPVQDYASEIWGFKNTEMYNKEIKMLWDFI